MCEFCVKHGEGKKWYLQMNNYSRELLESDGRQQYIQRFFTGFPERYARNQKLLQFARRLGPAYSFIRAIISANLKRHHYGQVLPLEDVQAILEEMTTVVRVACVCRMATIGKRQERYCYALSINPTDDPSLYPDLDGSLEELSIEEAARQIAKLDEEGLIHTVWTFGTPFIGGICNCDRNCLALRHHVFHQDFDVMFRGEYRAVVDANQCIGCNQCLPRCEFDALTRDRANRKVRVSPENCYGCGVCRPVCPTGAIRLVPARDTLPHGSLQSPSS